jgi:hypothetical protein
MNEKYDVAHHAALTWMAKTGMTVDPRFTYGQLTAYADELAMRLVMREGTRDAYVNGMEFKHTTLGWYVDFNGQFDPVCSTCRNWLPSE